MKHKALFPFINFALDYSIKLLVKYFVVTCKTLQEMCDFMCS